MRYLFAFLLLSLIAPAQALQFEDLPNRPGVRVGYNRFRDETVIATKPDIASGVIGKKSLLDPSANSRTLEIIAAAFFAGREPKEPITEIILGILPETTTKGGRFVQRMERGPLYIAPDASIIVIADGERFELGRVTKTDSLNVLGQYSGAAFVGVPFVTFEKIVSARKLEMAAGSIEIKLQRRTIERMQSLAAEVQARRR